MLNLARIKKVLKGGEVREYVYAWRGGPRLFEREGSEAFRAEYEAACLAHKKKISEHSKRRTAHYNQRKVSLSAFAGTRLYHNSKARAAKRGLEFSLSRDDIRGLVEKQGGRCALTDIRFDLLWKYGKDSSTNPFAPSLDRIDCKVGYVRSNVRLVLFSVNAALNEWGTENFLQICHAMIEQEHRRSISAA